jgi:hypothetical protein
MLSSSLKLTTTQFTDAQAILRPYLNWGMLILPFQSTDKHKLSSFFDVEY